MEELKMFVTVAANLGGVGVLAYYLLQLHKDSLVAFRKELELERSLFREMTAVERAERKDSLAVWRGEKAEYHHELLSRLDRIDGELREIRKLCETV